MANFHSGTIHLDPKNPQNVFGLPPGGHVSDHMIYNTMPVLEIRPGEPNLTGGLTVFQVSETEEIFKSLLLKQGFTAPYPPRFAYIADSFPSDSFTNEYGETFLAKFTDVASQGFGQIAQMTGSRNFTESAGKIGGAILKAGKQMGGLTGQVFEAAGAGAVGAGELAGKIKNAFAGTELAGMGRLVDKMLAGARVDFPQVWRNSGFTPSYSVTIRLYNPKPGNLSATKRWIIGPLAILMCLTVPRSDDGQTYNWPFFHQIKCEGIWNLNPAVITNLTVIKGGDQQSIGWNQRMGIVDVRLDIGSLYTSMLVEEAGMMPNNRPTVRNYLESLQGQKWDPGQGENEVYGAAERKSGMIPVTTSLPGIPPVKNSGFDPSSESRFIGRRPGVPPTTPESVVTGIVDRVTTNAQNIANGILTDLRKQAGGLFG